MKKYILFIAALIISNIIYAQTYNMSNGATINTCAGTFYDSGNTGVYSNNENITRTFCSSTPGAQITFSFSTFNVESNWDYLYIYDGPTTASPILVTATGNSAALIGQTISSSTGCLTFNFTSDGSGALAGWIAAISCTFPCQPFSVNINNTTPEFFNGDTVHICQNTPLTLTAAGTFPNSGTNYTQQNSTTTFTWNFGDGSAPVSGIGMTSITHTWPPGAYYVTLDGKDINNCHNSNLARIMVIVSITPLFAGTDISPDTICPGETINLDGQHVQAVPWSVVIDTMVAGLTYLPDGQGVPYETVISNTLFLPGQTMQATSDIVSVCINMEHSFLGDLTIHLVCPNGQFLDIFTYSNGLGSTWFGVPIDDDLNTAPGIGYTYCWTPGATNPVPNMSSQSVPAGNYQPTGPFSALLGCPMNGNWTIHVEDHLGSDNGYIFNWQLQFNSAIIPPQFTFVNVQDSTVFNWVGPSIISQNNGLGTASPMTSGTNPYTFELVDDFGCPYDTIINMFVRSATDPMCCIMPVVSAGTDTSLCSTSYTFNALLSSGNTGIWSIVPGAPGTATVANPTSPNSLVTVNQWGTYNFVWSETSGSVTCTQRDTVAITFNQTPNSTFTASPVLCFGDTCIITYTGNGLPPPTGVYSYGWDGGSQIMATGGTSAGPWKVTWATANTYNVTLFVTQNGCSSAITTVPVLIPTEMQHTNTLVHNLCFGDQLGSITINTSGGTLPYTYSWASYVSVLNNLAAGTYPVTVTDANGCNFSENLTITEPTAFVINDTTFKEINCFGGNDGFVNIDVAGGTGIPTYVWNPVMPNSQLQTNLPTGTYQVTATDENGCFVTETFVLDQPQELNLTVSPGVSLCFGVSTTMQATCDGGVLPYTYLWNGAPSTASLTVTPTVTSTYVAQIQDAHNCLSNTEGVTVIVSPKMVPVLSLFNNSCFNSCDGKAIYAVSGGITPLIYSWPSATNTLSSLCAGLYTVTVTDQIGCFVDTSFSITQPAPLAYSTTNTSTTCWGYNNGSASVTVQGGTQPYWYFWSNGSNMANATNLFAGTYYCTVHDVNNCTVNPIVIVTQPSKVYVTSSDDQTICIGGSVNISSQVMGGIPPYSYSWVADTLAYSGPVVMANPLTTTTYYLTVTDRNNCAGNTQMVTVNVTPSLQMSISTIDDTICPGSPANIRMNITGGNGGPYMIYLNNGTIVAPPFDVFPTVSQTYILEVHDRCETPSIVDSIHIEVLPEPPVNPMVDKYSGCAPLNLSFIEPNLNEGQTYTWIFGDGVNSEGSVAKNPVHIFNYPGTYTVTLTVTSLFGCSKTVTITNPIYVYPVPEARFFMRPDVVSIVDPRIEFINLSVGADTAFWSFGDGDSSLIYSPTHYYGKIGTYTVDLIARTEYNCTDTVSQNVVIKEEYSIYAPTAFSPNNDERNDFFNITGNGIHPDDFLFIIYNKWGEKIFETKDKDKQWDGKYKGKTVESGVYTWVVSYKDTNGNGHQKAATVTVIR